MKLDNQSRAAQTGNVTGTFGALFSQVTRAAFRDIQVNNLARGGFTKNSRSNVLVRRFSYYAQQRVN
jgi:hypothetical protein